MENNDDTVTACPETNFSGTRIWNKYSKSLCKWNKRYESELKVLITEVKIIRKKFSEHIFP
jgi:hypothetical protein